LRYSWRAEKSAKRLNSLPNLQEYLFLYMAECNPTIALGTWSNIQKTFTEELRITYQGNNIVCMQGAIDDFDAIKYIESLRSMLDRYQNELENIYGVSKRKRVSDNISIKLTHVYLMLDKKSGFHKIGRSSNPKFRERTLQSELPVVEMIFISPITYAINEKKLHQHFSDKRIRGEWFNLSEMDIFFIMNYNYGQKVH